MTLFRNVVFVAALAGLCAGIAMAVMQAYATVPLILQAETFENSDASGAADTAQGDHDTAAGDHGQSWAPADGFERFFYTTAANIVTGVGFALMLVALSELAGGIQGWREGIFWGFAGFAVFTLAPGLGLPPELPAMPAAEVTIRQIWWIGTALATAIGLALMVFRRSAPLAVLAIVLIVVPHLIGAPQPESHETPVPDGLQHSFVVAVTITSLVFWLILGAAAGIVRERFSSGLDAPQGSLA